MAKIVKAASAGTLESSDVYVEVEPGTGVQILLDSVVAQQFGSSIEAAVREVVAQQGVEDVTLRIADRGALDCVIRARVEAALLRGKGDAGC